MQRYCFRLALVVLAIGFAGIALAQADDLVVKDVWARATPGGAQTGAVYATIISPTADRLIGVSSPAAKTVGLHSMSMDGGVMRMRSVAAIDLPAGQSVKLEPGGFHVMLEGLNQPLQEGQTFPLTLTFEKAGNLKVIVTVSKAGSMGPMEGMPMHH